MSTNSTVSTNIGAHPGRRPIVVVQDRTTHRRSSGCTPGSDIPSVESLGELLGEVLRAEGVPPHAEAGLHLVGIEEMSRLNADSMGVEGPTDVLSFPIDGAACAGEEDGRGSVDAPAGDQGPDGGSSVAGEALGVLVGDVVLCPEVARRNAADHAGTIADELRLLVVHGGLHLCGWDHAGDGDRRAMWDRERGLMAALRIPPSRDPWTRS